MRGESWLVGSQWKRQSYGAYPEEKRADLKFTDQLHIGLEPAEEGDALWTKVKDRAEVVPAVADFDYGSREFGIVAKAWFFPISVIWLLSACAAGKGIFRGPETLVYDSTVRFRQEVFIQSVYMLSGPTQDPVA